MPSRVSTTQMADSSLYSITGAYSRLDEAQRRVNTGRRIEKPSDDPSGTAQVLNLRARLSEIEQFGRAGASRCALRLRLFTPVRLKRASFRRGFLAVARCCPSPWRWSATC